MPGQRPFVLLSAAVSLDGHLDDASPDRLLLSDAADFDRVDEERAAADAILVGGNTLRADNPRLLVNDPGRGGAPPPGPPAPPPPEGGGRRAGGRAPPPAGGGPR
ncbi:RibD family protein, partial [Kitasatospora sp. NPDC059577]|uniref:RibD family protein n=1 Tax=Kitasatospora sp. NPDC059577 TaxID=3346873 RepID=UPI003699E238